MVLHFSNIMSYYCVYGAFKLPSLTPPFHPLITATPLSTPPSALSSVHTPSFKDVFKFENYLLMEDKYRINISKFRCRYNHPPISRRYSLDYDCDIKC